jgi:hypothetical protein
MQCTEKGVSRANARERVVRRTRTYCCAPIATPLPLGSFWGSNDRDSMSGVDVSLNLISGTIRESRTRKLALELYQAVELMNERIVGKIIPIW